MDILEFVEGLTEKQREVIFVLHDYLIGTHGLSYKIRYKIPFYDRKNWICYLNPTKKKKVELAFVRGNELSNSQGLLSSMGRKQVYGVTFEHALEIPMNSIEELVQEALVLDDMVKYNVRKK